LRRKSEKKVCVPEREGGREHAGKEIKRSTHVPPEREKERGSFLYSFINISLGERETEHADKENKCSTHAPPERKRKREKGSFILFLLKNLWERDREITPTTK